MLPLYFHHIHWFSTDVRYIKTYIPYTTASRYPNLRHPKASSNQSSHVTSWNASPTQTPIGRVASSSILRKILPEILVLI